MWRFDWSLFPGWFAWVVIGGGLFLFAASGLLLQWTVRPRDRGADVLTGLATGAVAGLTAFTLVMGPMVLVGLVRPHWDDLRYMQQAAKIDRSAEGGKALNDNDKRWEEFIVAWHPGFENLTNAHQVSELERLNYQAHLVDELAAGVWWGVFSTMLGAMTVCSQSAAVAGFFVRRDYRTPTGRWWTRWAALAPFGEMTLLGLSALWFPLIAATNALGTNFTMPPLDFIPFTLLLWAFALVGVSYKWSLLTRWTAYIALFCCIIFWDSVWERGHPTFLKAIGWSVGLALALAVAHVRAGGGRSPNG